MFVDSPACWGCWPAAFNGGLRGLLFCRAARVVAGLGALLAVRVVGCFHAHVTHVCALRLVKESDYNGCGWFLLFCRLFMAIFGEMWGFLLFTIWFFRFSDQGLNVILIF
jgi:hypothetical protein